MSRERMTRRIAADDSDIKGLADEIAKLEKITVSKSCPCGNPDLKDYGDQNAKANSNWNLTDADREMVAMRLVHIASQMLAD